MADGFTTINAIIEKLDDGEFYYSLDDGETHVGPFESEQVAQSALEEFLSKSLEDLVRRSLGVK